MQTIELVFALSADLSALEASIATLVEPQSLPEFYVVARHAYMCGNLEDLQSFILKLKNQSNFPTWFVDLIDLRWHIRLKIRHPFESQIKANFSNIKELPWRAEMAMVLAMYYEELRDYGEALFYYRKSATEFYQCQIPAKALTAEYNGLIVQSLASPQKRYLVAYQTFIQRAINANNQSLAGVALANLSREYQLLGLHELAILRANEAIQILASVNFGSLNYFLAVAQLLDLNLKTSRYRAAIPLYEELQSSPFRETSGIIEILNSYCLNTKEFQHAPFSVEENNNIPVPWMERLKEKSTNFFEGEKNSLSDNESIVIDLLSSGCKSLSDLSTLIYGNKIQWESALARTKQTIYRLRKKYPELIVNRNGHYELSD